MMLNDCNKLQNKIIISEYVIQTLEKKLSLIRFKFTLGDWMKHYLQKQSLCNVHVCKYFFQYKALKYEL